MTGTERLDQGFLDFVAGLEAGPSGRNPETPLVAGGRLTGAAALELLESQMISRHLDLAARYLRQRQQGYYTIGSSGHEGNVVVARALRVTDPAFLHYRSGGFFVERARQLPGQQPIRDLLLGLCAARDEPIAGGRHKVFGSGPLNIPPQTSTIASHLPKAVGLSFALERGRRLGLATGFPDDALVCCSFGDGSANHSTAVGAINTASRIVCHQPAPILLVCEDNGLAISARTPPDWIVRAFGDRPGIELFTTDGCDLAAAFDAATAAVTHVRTSRRPALLHLRMVRLLGHAGADVEMVYRSESEIAADEARDPLRISARLLVAAGLATPAELRDQYQRIRTEVAESAEAAAIAPKLASAAEVMAPLAPHSPAEIASEVARPVDAAARECFWQGRLPELGPTHSRGRAAASTDEIERESSLPLAGHLNRALGDLLIKYPELLLFGMDVGRKGGVYGVTRGLERRAGMARVFDTIIDEQTILGLAIGAGHAGMLPIPEIQYLAYLHNAEDQLRGEAASLQFFSQGQYRNPMVVRIASYAYQKGFGGHFHNDNSIAVLRDIPGLVIASPSRGDDAAAMLRTCVAAARIDGAVCAFLEPIALYATRDLEQPGDGELAATYDPVSAHIPIGATRSYGDGSDLLLVSFANGVPMSRRVARRLERERKIRCRVLDLRWLAPLPMVELLAAAERVERLLIVDETRRSGGVGEGVVAELVAAGYRGQIRRVCSRDSFVPLGPAADHVLLGEAEIEAAAVAMFEAER